MNFENALLVRNLMWFEGALLSQIELNDKAYLIKWVDVVEEETRNYHIWLVIEVLPEILDLFFTKNLTLRDVEERAPAVFIQEGFMEISPAAYTEYENIPDDWKATSTSYYDESLSHDQP